MMFEEKEIPVESMPRGDNNVVIDIEEGEASLEWCV